MLAPSYSSILVIIYEKPHVSTICEKINAHPLADRGSLHGHRCLLNFFAFDSHFS